MQKERKQGYVTGSTRILGEIFDLEGSRAVYE